MARKIVVLCDIHLSEHDEEVEAVKEETISFGGMKPRIIAVCAECDREFIEPLKVLITEVGQIADSPSHALPAQKVPAPKDFSCPSCGREYKYKKSLRTHAQEVHGVTLSDLLKESDPEEQLQLGIEEENKPKVARAECDQPDCDVVYEWPENRRPAQALGLHKSSVHGIKGKSAGKGQKVPA